jgi:phage terminase large subunit-like protein
VNSISTRKDKYNLQDALKELADNLHVSSYAPSVTLYKPHAKQERFHKSQAKIRLYIGGNRSGKTTGGIVEDIWWLTRKHPYYELPNRPIRGRIVSVDFNQGITQIVIPQLKQWVPKSEFRGGSWESAYSTREKVLYFENGSTVELMSYEQNVESFAGTSRDFVHYDEEPPKAIYDECQARLIDTGGRSWITMTPVEGMTWVHDEIYQPGITGSDRIMIIEVDMAENPYLNPSEVAEYLGSLSEDERLARGQGKFVQMGGLVYKLFSPKIHVIDVIDPKDLIGSNFKHYMSLDHGFNNPTSVHWHAVDSGNTAITFDEHYEAGRTIDYHAEVIKRKNKEHGRGPDINVADPAITQRQGITGTSIQTEYAIRGIGFVLGNNDMLTGIAKVNQYLEVRDGKPHWYITRNCVNLISELQKLRWKTWASKKQQYQNNPSDMIHKKDDHATDECRYFFSLMPTLGPLSLPNQVTKLPNITTTTSHNPYRKRIDKNLTPARLGRDNNEWKVTLNDDDS